MGKESLYIGRPFHRVLIGKSNWSAFGVVKRFLGFRKFMGKLSWTESRVSVFDDRMSTSNFESMMRVAIEGPGNDF